MWVRCKVCKMHFLRTGYLLDMISLFSFRFRLMLTPFRWDVTSAQRTHTAQFFIHVTFSCLISVMGLCRELWSPACYPPGTQVEGLLLSSPSICGLCSSHGIWGSLWCSILQKGGNIWEPWRIILLSFWGSSFSDERQTDLPLEGAGAVDDFPPSVGNMLLSWRRQWGLAIGSSFPLFLED